MVYEAFNRPIWFLYNLVISQKYSILDSNEVGMLEMNKRRAGFFLLVYAQF